MSTTICAQVNPRLLSKANRLFTGSLQGRIIEILQNARRAGATRVWVTNRDGEVIVRDNGSGIEDFQMLLDLGGSSWPADQELEDSEDPAGVGLFCLAPRKVTVRSNGRLAVIEANGWGGAAVKINDDLDSISGTLLVFEDEVWSRDVVEPLAVFTGMTVTVDGQACAKEPFIRSDLVHHHALGCRIQVVTYTEMSQWQRCVARVGCVGEANVIVNFHGQTVGFSYRPINETSLYYLVDLTGTPTGIRLMLPARTQLVENEAFEQLRVEIERQAYLHLQHRGRHSLPYKQYLRAKELGIDLPESDPVYKIGLLQEDEYGVAPAELAEPKDFDLARCYRFDPACDDDEGVCEANTHLLAALGTFDQPFIPVAINQQYDGYTWADLPRITDVQVEPGKVQHESWVWSGKLICVDSVEIVVRTSDGDTFSSEVCMALRPLEEDKDRKLCYHDGEVYITVNARKRLDETNIWFHVGGYNDEGDTWDTQQSEFNRAMEQFWAEVIGPDEPLRQHLVEAALKVKGEWKAVTIQAAGNVQIHFADGSHKTITPPEAEGGAS